MDEQNNVVDLNQAPQAPQGGDNIAIKIVALALGITAITGAWWGVASFIPLACGVVAIILGVKGRKAGGRLVPMATVGMILGIVGIVLSVIGLICGICVCAAGSIVENADYSQLQDALNDLTQSLN